MDKNSYLLCNMYAEVYAHLEFQMCQFGQYMLLYFNNSLILSNCRQMFNQIKLYRVELKDKPLRQRMKPLWED